MISFGFFKSERVGKSKKKQLAQLRFVVLLFCFPNVDVFDMFLRLCVDLFFVCVFCP